ncbi:hypothetical protein EDC37_10515 [Pectinatus cerevisiiphilus]|uniref:Uncharacterized protein n=1 Tax=Pectinatus cerevisiiphilus TaxID=86956 RepID=A0A4R3KAD4_9FIRM|nr:hypothetical protein EDC37_10515 [Pectinatus cerevisiiphilus]
MFLIQTMRIMAGPYLCNLADMYYANQDILNTIVVLCGAAWIFYKRYTQKTSV